MKKLSEINFGSEDAETEMILEKGSYFTKVYIDCFGIQKQIENGKFVVHGRKGTGKSAFACHMERSVSDQIFCTKLAFKMNEIEEMIQSPEIQLRGAKLEALWRWIALCHIGKFILNDNSIQLLTTSREDLETFYSRNQGYCEPTAYKLKEKVESEKLEIAVAALNRLLQLNGITEHVIKGTKASFLELLYPLGTLMKKIFSECKRDVENKFYLIVDDLDHGYIGTDSQKDAVLGILRAFKQLMVDFQSVGMNFYPVVLIRTDMLLDLSKEADLNKIIMANGIKLIWYDHDQFRNDEKGVFLRKLISTRLKYSFGEAGQLQQNQDFWNILFLENSFEPKSSFKYVLDRTLYRPRDLIAMLNILKSVYPSKTQITKKMIEGCLSKFSEYMLNEWKGELSAHLSSEAAEELLNAVQKFRNDFTFDEWKTFQFIRLDPEHALEEAFKFGLVGQKIQSGGRERSSWSHRPSNDSSVDFSIENTFMTHFAAMPRDRRLFTW